MSDVFDIDDRGPVRLLTLNRPQRKNAVPPEGWALLAEAFAEFERSDSRVLVISGAGGDFCAGADVSPDFTTTSDSAAENAAWMKIVGDAAVKLHRLSKPTIAAVDGVAVGAGMNLALGCDVVIATDRARFAEIFVRRGLTLDFGGTWLLPRIVGLAKARELALTGRLIDAAEAEQVGLVTRVVPAGDLDAAVAAVVTDLLAAAPLAQAFVKRALDRSSAMTFEEAIAYESQAQAVLLASQDFKEAVAAFAQKRPPEFEGR
jgi:2-(1,2-epoxy-1,2-dihydrophenyl)acetyl-CoA isomerase